MKQKLLASLQKRIDDELSIRNPVKFLKAIPIDTVLNTSISIVYLYTREKKGTKFKSILLTEVISAIGHTLRSKGKMKKDSALAAKAGAFVLYSFEQLGMIHVKKGTGANGHGTYLIDVTNDEAIVKLWESVPDNKTEKLPSLTPFDPWVSYKHPSGMTIVKTTNKDILEELTPETHPMVFATLNKAQSTGWTVNKDLFPLVNWALRNKADAFADIWEIQNDEAKRSKLREATAVAGIAKRFVDNVFYHLYYFDFR